MMILFAPGIQSQAYLGESYKLLTYENVWEIPFVEKQDPSLFFDNRAMIEP
jgi:hypothetical protein